ncbi:helix-turn-helix domain-containing protein [Weissella minor]|uniref:helix-turn-helix domain-containing protein n=1 Tax=Weissella minor TaxID=1620 RepID=UPI003AF1FEAA
MTLFERTKQTAQEKGLTLRELEKRAGLGEKSIYSWKKYTPRGSNMQKVADVLGVSVDYLLGNTDEMHPTTEEDNKKPDLDELLNDEGALMFQGMELSDDYKRALLAMLETYKGQNGK